MNGRMEFDQTVTKHSVVNDFQAYIKTIRSVAQYVITADILKVYKRPSLMNDRRILTKLGIKHPGIIAFHRYEKNPLRCPHILLHRRTDFPHTWYEASVLKLLVQCTSVHHVLQRFK